MEIDFPQYGNIFSPIPERESVLHLSRIFSVPFITAC